MQTIGRYEIIEELGRGAMGVVYRARDTQIGRVVALKVVLTANASAQDIEKFKQRFHREAQAAGRLSHPGIVTIHDIAEDDAGQPYIVMEFVEGRPLNLLLGPTAQVPLERLLDIGIQVAQALDYAHKNGVVHRDIKPPNILVTPDGRVKIADFGIARLEGTELTLEGTSLGTPSYMSPEQFRGGAVDGRSDIFSLGAVLYWMCTGRKPFPGENITITSFQVAYENPPPPTLAKTSLPKALDDVLMRCLAKNPASRYSTAGDLAADLDAVKAGRPLPTHLGTQPERTEPFPLPSRKIEPPRPDRTAEIPAANPDEQTRVAMHATQTMPARPAPPAKRSSTPLLAVAGAVVLLALIVAGQWYWRRAHSTPPTPPATTVAPIAAPVPAPAAVSPAGTPPAAENSSGESATPQTPPSETARSEPAPAVPKRSRTRPATFNAAASQPATPLAPAATKPVPPAPVAAIPPPAAAPAVVLSNLEVDCKFPFDHGTLEVAVDGNSLLDEKLDEKRLKKFLGITTSRDFQRKDNPIAVGEHRIRVRIAGKDGKPAWEESISATIAKDVATKLDISFKEGSDTDPGKRKLVLSLEQVK